MKVEIFNHGFFVTRNYLKMLKTQQSWGGFLRIHDGRLHSLYYYFLKPSLNERMLFVSVTVSQSNIHCRKNSFTKFELISSRSGSFSQFLQLWRREVLNESNCFVEFY